MNNNLPKILLVDIETAPAEAYVWGMYDQCLGVPQIKHDGYVLMWCAKWLGTKEILFDTLLQYPKHFQQNHRSDLMIAKSIHKLMSEADIIVGHNGDKFDIKWLNTIFRVHKLKPISGYKTIDTLKVAKTNFRFMSNKLDFIVRKFKLGKKIDTGGFDLWLEVMAGDVKAHDKMLRYCKHDVRLLERLYKYVRPTINNHPNMNLYRKDGKPVCRNCGSNRLMSDGLIKLVAGVYQGYECRACGKKQRGTERLFKTSVL